MTLFVCWVVAPVVLALLALGCGLLVEQAAGIRLPGVLLVPLGLAVVVVAANLMTAVSVTAQFTTGLVVALAVTGLALSYPWRDRRPDGWALAAGMVLSLLLHVGMWFLVSRLFAGTPGPSPVVE